MTLLAGFFEVLCKALGLIGFCLAAGGIFFALFVLIPEKARVSVEGLERVARLVTWGALLLALSLLSVLLVQMFAAAEDTRQWPWRELLATRYARIALLQAALSLALAGVAHWLRQHDCRSLKKWSMAAVALAAVSTVGAGLVHGASRMDEAVPLMAVTVGHQIGAAVWGGGVFHLVLLWRLIIRDPESILAWPQLLERFSRLAMCGILLILLSGLFLGTRYIGGITPLLGTAYGSMVVSKVCMLGFALILGGMNFLMIRGWRTGQENDLNAFLPAFAEAEACIALILVLSAASLTSQPPSVDVLPQAASLGEVAQVFSLKAPRVMPPPYQEVLKNSASSLDLFALPTRTDRLQSDFNHNIAGIIVLMIGIAALLAQRWPGRVSKNWPLLFLLLALFLILLGEPNGWPFGYEGLWETLVSPGVLQHRLATLVVLALAIFQWRVETGRATSPRHKYFFPLLCLMGGALLLSHSHSVFAIKWAFLIELSHLAIGVLAVLLAVSKWLELRLLPPENRIPALIWPWCIIAVGYVLIIYKES